MFGFSLPMLVLLFFWLILLLFTIGKKGGLALAFRWRILTYLLGAVLILGSFVFQPWIKLEFVEYFFKPPEALSNVVSKDTILKILDLIKPEWLFFPLKALLFYIDIKGWQIIFIPTFTWITRLLMICPTFLAVIVSTYFPFAPGLRSSSFSKFVGGFFAFFGLICAIGLALSMPEIDALGIHSQFELLLASSFTGVRIGNGPWLTVVGLLLMTLGGLIELGDQSQRSSTSNQDN